MEAVMEKFEGQKFFCVAEHQVRDESVWWEEKYVNKAEFMMTSTYRKYLKEKRKEKQKTELGMLKARLEYQYKTYGEVDPIDFSEYMAKVKEYSKEYPEKS